MIFLENHQVFFTKPFPNLVRNDPLDHDFRIFRRGAKPRLDLKVFLVSFLENRRKPHHKTSPENFQRQNLARKPITKPRQKISNVKTSPENPSQNLARKFPTSKPRQEPHHKASPENVQPQKLPQEMQHNVAEEMQS